MSLYNSSFLDTTVVLSSPVAISKLSFWDTSISSARVDFKLEYASRQKYVATIKSSCLQVCHEKNSSFIWYLLLTFTISYPSWILKAPQNWIFGFFYSQLLAPSKRSSTDLPVLEMTLFNAFDYASKWEKNCFAITSLRKTFLNIGKSMHNIFLRLLWTPIKQSLSNLIGLPLAETSICCVCAIWIFYGSISVPKSNVRQESDLLQFWST